MRTKKATLQYFLEKPRFGPNAELYRIKSGTVADALQLVLIAEAQLKGRFQPGP